MGLLIESLQRKVGRVELAFDTAVLLQPSRLPDHHGLPPPDPLKSIDFPPLQPICHSQRMLRAAGASPEREDGSDEELHLGVDVRPIPGLPASFEDLLLPRWLCDGLRRPEREGGLGFKRPTPVQQVVIPRCHHGKHLIVQAKSGTGKTVSFAAAALARTAQGTSQWSVVVAPTRELAIQHHRVLQTMAKWAPSPHPEVLLCVGGQSQSQRKWSAATHARENEAMARLLGGDRGGILCATPGRLSAVLATRNFSREAMRRVRCVVLDEADRLMDGNYDDDLAGFLEGVPERSQVLCFSATYTSVLLARIENITGRTNFVVPGECAAASSLGNGGDPDEDVVSLKRVDQYYHVAAPGAGARSAFDLKADSLVKEVLPSLSFDQAIVFCNAKSGCLDLARRLREGGHENCFHVYGEMKQTQRSGVMERMRRREGRILVSTDLVSRGIDLPAVNLVVNMDLPREGATLMHRVGRAGRYGRKGRAVHILCSSQGCGEGEGRDRKRLSDLLAEAGASASDPKPLFPPKAPSAAPAEGDISETSEEASPPPTVVGDLPDHVQRWLWWKWRHEWWCRLKESATET